MEPLRVFDENLGDARALVDIYDTFLTSSERDVRQSYADRINGLLSPFTQKTYVNRSNGANAYVAFTDASTLSWRDLRHPTLQLLLRAAHVQAVSALDCYFHDQIEWHFGRVLSTAAFKAHKKLRSFPLPVGEVKAVVDNYNNTTVGLRRAFEKELRKIAIQAPRFIEDKLQIIGVTGFWNEAAAEMGVPIQSLKDWLNEIAKRRNQIVHEGDRERLANGRLSRPRNILPDDVRDDIHVIDCFIYAIHPIIERDATA